MTVVDAGAALEPAAAALEGGGTVVLPTDTVYGLAALPAHTDALFRAKGRGPAVPIAVLCASADQALGLAVVDAAARDLATAHWPGALTLVLPRRDGLDWPLGDPADTIGVRVPDHGLVRAICDRVGPIATTSANRHGDPTPLTAAAAGASLLEPPAVIVDGGTLDGTASTVVSVVGGRWEVLRQGSVIVSPP